MIDLTNLGLSPALLQQLRQARTVPTGGIWYWYPTPDGWDLAAFNYHGPLTHTSSPDEEANVFHVQEFKEVVEHLAAAWRIDSLPLTRDSYQGIPRGRVSRNLDGSWKLEHGGEFATRHIKQLFALNEEPVVESVIEHEMTNAQHVEIVEKTLRYKTDEDRRIVCAFEALRNHKAVPGTIRSLSANAQVSLSIEQRLQNRTDDGDE